MTDFTNDSSVIFHTAPLEGNLPQVLLDHMRSLFEGNPNFFSTLTQPAIADDSNGTLYCNRLPEVEDLNTFMLEERLATLTACGFVSGWQQKQNECCPQIEMPEVDPSLAVDAPMPEDPVVPAQMAPPEDV